MRCQGGGVSVRGQCEKVAGGGGQREEEAGGRGQREEVSMRRWRGGA